MGIRTRSGCGRIGCPRLERLSHGAKAFRANLSSRALRNVPLIEVMIRTASSGVARNVPIPVHVERTRTYGANLLTGGTVLGQRHWSWSEKNEDRSESGGLRVRICSRDLFYVRAQSFFSARFHLRARWFFLGDFLMHVIFFTCGRARRGRGRVPCGLRISGSGRLTPQPVCGRAARLRHCRCWIGFR